ncbi:class I SAM-dependent methyltransferase [Candidatus Woesearchaeota archaeon]|nr:class I SAM-dependent methyltransferase [Candidatus Woesearchaeota archaeon]
MNETVEYWNKVQWSVFACPNPCLFRFMFHAGINIENKKVLDLGFGIGADLLEMQKRGAKTYGIDIDKRKVDDINKLKGNSKFPIVLHGNIATDIKNLNESFDFIFSEDMLYYLKEEELLQCLNEVKETLTADGKFLFQVITGDYKLVDGKEIFDPKAILKDSGNPILFRDEEFYISCLEKEGFKVTGKKLIKETFFANCEAVRHNLYICCSKWSIIK